MNAKFKVLIIGCGNMAGGYDLLQPDEALPLGHAKAFGQHGGFEVTSCIDPNTAQRHAFQSRWQVPHGFASWQDLPQVEGAFDVISICSPTVVHAHDIQAALALKPRLIFCEKPVTLHVAQTQQAVTDCANHQVLLAVNHSRRWSPEVQQLKQQLAQGQWGAVRSVSAVYNKGMLNNGSHMIDLLLNLFGPLHINHVGQAVYDHFDTDPSVDACLQTADGVPIQLSVAHAQDYALFEMQIVTEKGVISMEDGGARWRFRTAAPSTQLPGYNFLNHGEWLGAQGSPALRNAVTNLHDVLMQGAALACTGVHALQAQSLCEHIQQQAVAKLPQPQDRREAA
ncbi:MAG: Gfo/Idh/MocA family oxidoreductase [Limnohabitans sp.]|nr:Gfo/Idh/MocA family oxidoreductase [Limnohabitans sp.]